jgi:predicted deacylase
MIQESISIPGGSFGQNYTVSIRSYGSGARLAYLQASLHADELPGILVLDHLERLLTQAEAENQLCGQITVVPFANPIGLQQWVMGLHCGRYDLATQSNFNRDYPAITEAIAARITGKLGSSSSRNITLIREAMQAALAEWPAKTPVDQLRLLLMQRAVGADLCLDLHCDFEAPLHLYLGTPLWPGASDLAAELGAAVSLVAEVSGGNPFDEAVGGPWWELARRFADYPIPPACLAATVELRGEDDVDDQLAETDAAALFRVLKRRGFIKGPLSKLPLAAEEASPLAGVEMIRARGEGVLIWKTEIGARVQAGALLGELLNPITRTRSPIHSQTSGILYGRVRHHLARPDQIIAKVAGQQAWRSGHLLTD